MQVSRHLDVKENTNYYLKAALEKRATERLEITIQAYSVFRAHLFPIPPLRANWFQVKDL